MATCAALLRRLPSAELDGPARFAARRAKLSFERNYRADAQVLLFALPVVRRENVGSGSLLWREYDGLGSSRMLEFSAFSAPEHAAGLNRLGFFRELARTSESAGPESDYFGVMSATPEQNTTEARRALHSTSAEQGYTAIEGYIGGGCSRTSIAHFTAAKSVSGERRSELLDRARHALGEEAAVRRTAATAESLPSFLQALATMLARPDGKDGRYIYAGRHYWMRLVRSQDPSATAYFRERRLIGSAAIVERVNGRLGREEGGKETIFRLWIPRGAERPLPLRIEYQARPYLRLIFEAVPGDA
jgi:hypothetical protein